MRTRKAAANVKEARAVDGIRFVVALQHKVQHKQTRNRLYCLLSHQSIIHHHYHHRGFAAQTRNCVFDSSKSERDILSWRKNEPQFVTLITRKSGVTTLRPGGQQIWLATSHTASHGRISYPPAAQKYK